MLLVSETNASSKVEAPAAARSSAGVPVATTRPASKIGDAVAEPLGLVHEVGDQQDGDAGGAHAFDQPPRFAAGVRVEPGGQLVEDGQLGVAHQRERDRHALLLAAGQLPE